MNRSYLFVLAALLCGLVASCNSPQEAAVSGLKVELVSIERGSDGTVNATVRVLNPNVVAYNVAEAEHRVHLNGQYLGKVTIDRPLGVPAQTNVAQHTGPLKLEGGATLPNGQATYRMESELLLRLWGDSTQGLKLTANGTVTVK